MTFQDALVAYKTLTYIDDTHMIIGIAESLIKARGFNGKDMAYTFIKNYEQGYFISSFS